MVLGLQTRGAEVSIHMFILRISVLLGIFIGDYVFAGSEGLCGLAAASSARLSDNYHERIERLLGPGGLGREIYRDTAASQGGQIAVAGELNHIMIQAKQISHALSPDQRRAFLDRGPGFIQHLMTSLKLSFPWGLVAHPALAFVKFSLEHARLSLHRGFTAMSGALTEVHSIFSEDSRVVTPAGVVRYSLRLPHIQPEATTLRLEPEADLQRSGTGVFGFLLVESGVAPHGYKKIRQVLAKIPRLPGTKSEIGRRYIPYMKMVAPSRPWASKTGDEIVAKIAPDGKSVQLSVGPKEDSPSRVTTLPIGSDVYELDLRVVGSKIQIKIITEKTLHMFEVPYFNPSNGQLLERLESSPQRLVRGFYQPEFDEMRVNVEVLARGED